MLRTASHNTRLTMVFALFVVISALVAAGCGSDDGGGGGDAAVSKSDSLKYVSKDATGVIVLNTDFESDAWQTVWSIVRNLDPDAEPSVTDALAKSASDSDDEVDWDADFASWLGDDAGVSINGIDAAAAAAAAAGAADAAAEAATTADAGAEVMEKMDGSESNPVSATMFLASTDRDKAESYFKREGTAVEGESSDFTYLENEDGDGYVAIGDDVVLMSDNLDAVEASVKTGEGDEDITDAAGFDDATDALRGDTVVSGFFSLDGGTERLAELFGGDTTALDQLTDEQTATIDGLQAASFGLAADGKEAMRTGLYFVFEDEDVIKDMTNAYKPERFNAMPAGTVLAGSFGTIGTTVEDLLAQAATADAGAAAENLGAAGAADALAQAQALAGQFEGLTGLTGAEFAELMSGEAAIGLGAGSPLPGLGLAFESGNDDLGTKFADTLLVAIGGAVGSAPVDAEAGGIDVKQANLGGILVAGGVDDGVGVIATDESYFESQFGDGDTLGDSSSWKDLKDAAGVDDEVEGVLYIDFAGILGLIEDLGPLTGQADLGEQFSMLEAFEGFVGWAQADGATFGIEGYVALASGEDSDES